MLVGVTAAGKQRAAVMVEFSSFRDTAITVASFELMHRIRKGHSTCGVLVFCAELRPNLERDLQILKAAPRT